MVSAVRSAASCLAHSTCCIWRFQLWLSSRYFGHCLGSFGMFRRNGSQFGSEQFESGAGWIRTAMALSIRSVLSVERALSTSS